MQLNKSDMELSLDDYILKKHRINVESKIWRNYTPNFNINSQQWRLQPEYRGRFPGMPRLIDSVNVKSTNTSMRNMGTIENICRNKDNNYNHLFVKVNNNLYKTKRNKIGNTAQRPGKLPRLEEFEISIPNNAVFKNSIEPVHNVFPNHTVGARKRNKSVDRKGVSSKTISNKPEYYADRRNASNFDDKFNTLYNSAENTRLGARSNRSRRSCSCSRGKDEDNMSTYSGKSAVSARSMRSVKSESNRHFYYDRKYKKSNSRALKILESTYNPKKYVSEYINYNIRVEPNALATTLNDRFSNLS